MSATTVALSPQPGARDQRPALAWTINDVIVLTRRSLARIAREPESLMDVTVMPVVFVLLFAYVFGSAIHIPGGGNYHEYLIGGMLGMGLAGTAPGTTVGLVTDMSTGLIDRFRSLPMSRAAVLAGRTIADLLTQVIGLVVVVAVGLAIGWRVHTGPADVAAALGLALLLGYAFTWMGACLGMLLRSVEAAQATGFLLFLPLTFISNAFVPTQGMPGWLQAFANWNPLSALAAACRHLFGNPNPAAAGAGLADAAPGADRGAVGGRPGRGVRAAQRAAVPAQGPVTGADSAGGIQQGSARAGLPGAGAAVASGAARSGQVPLAPTGSRTALSSAAEARRIRGRSRAK